MFDEVLIFVREHNSASCSILDHATGKAFCQFIQAAREADLFVPLVESQFLTNVFDQRVIITHCRVGLAAINDKNI